ncbi:putative protein kinase RLK-Pelle-LRR-XI-1 family [Lupinus albus]|uniref:Protein kinase domain-containing protein n=1 Tax=Lupinus albus TaxID=3870 RepID=A0A6A4R7T0_LUPAL|nr:putative protein kinase RLK-Pelle-LRR-XI-1 family [Lupinus albus]
MATTFCTYLIFLLSFTFTIFNLSSSSSPSESDILLSFKASIQDSKNALSTWSNTSSNHYCNWFGISCSTTKPISVTSINLQSLNLSGDISSSICDLPKLSYLNLADNVFNEPIPLHLSQCSFLETLNLSNNLIWGTIPSQISQLGSLKVLDLSRNHIEGNIPESLGALKNLQVLNMGSNLLSRDVPAIFGNLTKLEVLDLSQNPYLVSEIPKDIGELGSLKQLLLQSSSFQVLGEAAFKSSLDSEGESSCYNAPEYGYNKKPSEQLDVYSFGVVLLELVSGKQAYPKEENDESLDIVKWVRRKVNITNGVQQILDPRISHTFHHEMIEALNIALSCISVVPQKRPSMVDVVRDLQSLESRTCIANLKDTSEEQSISM